jgi:hypothetical protein
MDRKARALFAVGDKGATRGSPERAFMLGVSSA